MKKGLFIFIVLLFGFMLLMAGCSGTDNGVETDLQPDSDKVTSPPLPEMPIVITDQMGREVVIEEIPQRIISLSPSNTEIVFALGLGDRVVGVTEYCNYPAEALEKDIVGGFSTPNIEKIIELEPDLILASTIHEEEVPRLEELGIPVMVIESSTVADLFVSIQLVAIVADVPEAGESLVSSMQDRINAVGSVVAEVDQDEKIKVYYEVYSDPVMTAGQGAFINEIITLAGGINIFGDINENYPQVSAEVVAERQPDIILYPDYHGTADLVLDSMAGRPGWESIPAIQNSRIQAASDDIFARPGPRIVEAIEEAARLFYPELF
ncbi:MAG: cobalamin-binding protein [Bacillota bacterium]|nr:cobalamin-binding protein [Bacillota bacterium]